MNGRFNSESHILTERVLRTAAVLRTSLYKTLEQRANLKSSPRLAYMHK